MHGRLDDRPALEGADDVLHALDRRLSVDSRRPIVVALSGGGDSLALLRVAAGWAERANRPLLALTMDHGLHPASAAWTPFAAARAAESGAAFQALAWTGDKPAAGLPAAARRARHAALAVAARAAGAAVILMGHTADDGEETDRMRDGDAPGIGRLREWSPSPAWPQGRGVMLLRPMLRLRRQALRRWLAARAETWLDDPANDDTRFARIRARTALQSTPSPAPQDDRSDLCHEVRALAEQVEAPGEGALRLPLASLCAVSDDAAAHVLSVALLCAGGGDRPPRRAEVGRLLGRLRARGAPHSTLAGACVALKGDAVLLHREAGDRRRNPRSDVDGVIDGRLVETPDGPLWLGLSRFRAACFLIDREGDLSDQNQRLALNQTKGSTVEMTIRHSA